MPTDDNILGSTGNFGVYNDKLSVTKNIVNSGGNTPTPFTFRYNAIPSSPFAADSTCATVFSRPINYKLNLKLIDNSCNTSLSEFPLDRLIDSSAPFLFEKTVTLNKPYYTLSKEISVDEVKLAQSVRKSKKTQVDVRRRKRRSIS